MHLFRTICHADHRGRGSHDLALIATGDEELLQIKEDEDFRRQLAIDVVKEEFYNAYQAHVTVLGQALDRYGDVEIDEDPNAWTSEQKQRLADLMDDPKLFEKWENEKRWVSGSNVYDHSTGHWETTVYHIVNLAGHVTIDSRHKLQNRSRET